VPLSIGKLVNDSIQCGYHGLRFDATGCCVFMPGQDRIPAAARIKPYRAAERWQLVWIWMGDPERADEALIPDFSIAQRPGWAAVGEYLHLECNYLLAVDNLLDLSHISYVHERTIGTPDVARTPVTTEQLGEAVKVTRWMRGVPPPPTFKKLGNFGDVIDRWQIATATAPCYVWLEVGGAPAGTVQPGQPRGGGIERWNLNCITPETATTCHLFWMEVRNFGIDDPQVGETLRSQLAATLKEDADILAAQQRAMLEMPNAPTVDISFDAGARRFRRALQQKLADETSQAAPPNKAEA
jgi:vanillate O-demethylase monooxygenase subunit